MRRFCTIALLLPIGASCLVPQEIEEAEPQREGNRPPRIADRAPGHSNVFTQVGCQEEFSVTLEELDWNDVLQVRWFVNYGPGNTAPVHETRHAAPLNVGDGSQSVWTLQPQRYGPGTVVVEAVVSDGFDDCTAEPRERAVVPGKGWDETSWRVTIGEGPCLK